MNALCLAALHPSCGDPSASGVRAHPPESDCHAIMLLRRLWAGHMPLCWEQCDRNYGERTLLGSAAPVGVVVLLPQVRGRVFHAECEGSF